MFHVTGVSHLLGEAWANFRCSMIYTVSPERNTMPVIRSRAQYPRMAVPIWSGMLGNSLGLCHDFFAIPPGIDVVKPVPRDFRDLLPRGFIAATRR